MCVLRIIQTGYINFFIAAVLGLTLRFVLSGINLPFVFQHLLHAHSHTAILGWCSQTTLVLLSYHYLPDEKSYLNRLFVLAQIATTGMIISFIIQGYAMYSIIFSSIHLIISLIFTRMLWKSETGEIFNKKILRWALGFLVFSSIGILLLPVSIVLYGKNSSPYQLSIQFYLHFMFNGWLFLGPLSLLLIRFREVISTEIKTLTSKLVIPYSFIIAASFAYNISWYLSHYALYLITCIAALSQLYILWALLKHKKHLIIFKNTIQPYIIRILFYFAATIFVFKILIQLLLIYPEIYSATSHIRNLHIGFIHLLMLGFVSVILILITTSYFPKISYSRIFFTGVIFFISSIFFTEILIFIRGLDYWVHFGYNTTIQWALIFFSTALLFSTILLGISIFKPKNIVQ